MDPNAGINFPRQGALVHTMVNIMPKENWFTWWLKITSGFSIN
jgi:hypothetical protein